MSSIWKKKKMYFVSIPLIIIIGVILWSCSIIKTVYITYSEFKTIPDSITINIPLVTDNINGIIDDRFYVLCKINGEEKKLLVDTEAGSIVKSDDMEKYDTEYLGKSPIGTRNVYGQKEKMEFYRLNDFQLDTLKMRPCFYKIKNTNAVYYDLKDGILGSNILILANWKFSPDNGIVTFFKKDSLQFKDFTKIEHGLTHGNIELHLAPEISAKFRLDLGYNRELKINNETNEKLKKVYPYKIYKDLRNDGNVRIVTVFENINISFEGYTVENCTVVHFSDDTLIDANLIGCEFMRNFNFILAYEDQDAEDNLYIQPNKQFNKFQKRAVISKLGLNIGQRQNKILITRLEENGIAEQAGIALGDEVLQIDNFDLNNENLTDEFIRYTQDKPEITLQVKDKGKIVLSKN